MASFAFSFILHAKESFTSLSLSTHAELYDCLSTWTRAHSSSVNRLALADRRLLPLHLRSESLYSITDERFAGKPESKAPWAAHGWIAQSQVYFCPCGKTSHCAKLLVWRYMSPVRSFAWKSSANGNSDSGSQSLHTCQAAHQASTDKNNLTKKTIYLLLVVCSQCPITKL